MSLHRRSIATASVLALAGLLLLAGSPFGCGPEKPGSRILVLAADGMDPEAIDLLISEGKLPNFEKLQREGVYAPLRSEYPLLSPVVWTTVATGKRPYDHGIGHFVVRNDKSGQWIPVTSRMRRVKALWNIFSEMDRKVAVVGWWATWPAEVVNGAIVSDHLCYHFLFEDGIRGRLDLPGNTYPPELAQEIEPLVIRPNDLSYEEVSEYLDVDRAELDRPFDFNDDVFHFRWALATAKTYEKVGLQLWQEQRPDLELVYIEATDSVSHLFGHLFHADGLSGELARQQRRYGRAVEQIYRFADTLLGKMIAACDERTTLVVLSDHGFKLGQLPFDPSKMRDMRRVRANSHREMGILYLYGHQVRRGAKLEDPGIIDIAPTLLALAGLPVAEDMPGRVLGEALLLPELERVPTYESGEPTGDGPSEESVINAQILNRLGSLGYLDAGSPKSDQVLAGVLFRDKHYAEAEQAYRKLLQKDPDNSELHASLAATLGAMDRLDEALAEVETALELSPLNPVAYHDRAVIHERRGEIDAAIEDYRTALRLAPTEKKAREALIRLTGSDEAPLPADERLRQATELAEQAAMAARHGDYAKATDLLDRAEDLAPDLVLVYHYRSNVAYLKGDLEAARRALEKAIELDPDNPLYRENLARLERTTTTH